GFAHRETFGQHAGNGQLRHFKPPNTNRSTATRICHSKKNTTTHFYSRRGRGSLAHRVRIFAQQIRGNFVPRCRLSKIRKWRDRSVYFAKSSSSLIFNNLLACTLMSLANRTQF